MTFTETNNFQGYKYDNHGFHIDNGVFFLDTLKEWEIDFHSKHPICFANHLYANNSTMVLLNKCLILSSNESCGMELINGEIDFETDDLISKYSKINTIYGINSEIQVNKDEPIWLIIDDKIMDGTVKLKFIPDDDPDENEIPVPTERIKLKSK